MNRVLPSFGLRTLSLGLRLSCFGVLLLPGWALDWPQWRGPDRDGVSKETGLLESWPAGGPPLAWRTTGIGSGYVTVSVAAGRVYTAGDKGAENFVIALSEVDGKALWATPLGKAGAPGWGGFGGPRGTPTADGDLVFAVGQYGELACYETATGREVWRRELVADFGGKLPEWGFTESPLVDGEKVVVTPGGPRGALVALNKRTGDLLWQSTGFTDEAQYSSIIAADIGGVPQYIQLTMAHVAGVATADGKVLWQAPRKGSVAVIPTPIHRDGQVYVSSGYGVGGNLFSVALASGSFRAEPVYANKIMANHHGGVLLLGDHLYGHSEGKGWTCQDFKTGRAVWQDKSLGKGSLVCADGHLYLREENNGKSEIALIEATPAGYREKARFQQPDRSDKEAWPHPVVANGRLYIRDQDILLCFDVRRR